MERVELSIHTKMTGMLHGSINSAEEYIETARKWNWRAIAITDQDSVQAFPNIQRYIERHNITDLKVIYGFQCCFRTADLIKKGSIVYDTNITILTKNQKGIKNLYKLLSRGYKQCDEHYTMPILYKEDIDEFRDELIVISGEELNYIVLENDKDTLDNILSYFDFIKIIPERTMWIESQFSKENIKEANIRLVQECKELNKPVVASSNTIFIDKEEYIYNHILLNNIGINTSEYWQAEDNRYLYTTEEMLKEFEYLGKEKAYEVVVTNTNKIADMCEIVQPITDEKCYPHIDNAEELIKSISYKRAYEIYGEKLPIEIKERIELELNSIIENDFASLYILAYKVVCKSKEYGYLVKNRGTVGCSLVAYLLGITEIDPIKYNLPFEVFSDIDYSREPDIDLYIATECKSKIYKYIEELFGKDKVFAAGTVGRTWEKHALNMVLKYKNDTGIDLFADQNINYKKLCRIKRCSRRAIGWLIVIPKDRDINEFTPIGNIYTGDGRIDITHIEYNYLIPILLKIDLLEEKDLTMLHKLEETTGIDPTTIDLEEKETMNIFSSTELRTLGIPEFGKPFIMNILELTNPKTFMELVYIVALSHGTKVWNNNGEELIKNGKANLTEIISNREDLMTYLIEKGIDRKTSYKIMKFVQDGKCDDDSKRWKEYKSIMKQYNVPDWYIESCEKIEYLFPKAHAISNTINAFRIAWYKVHYPVVFYKTYFETMANIDIDSNILNNKENVLKEIEILEEQQKQNEEQGINNDKIKSEIQDYKKALEMLENGIIL